METQLKKGLLDIVVLSALKREDSYGYKIIQEVSQVVEMSESTLYPILKRLEKAQSVSTYSVEYNGRLRKYYAITSLGEDKIVDFLDDLQYLEKIYNYITEVSK